MGDAGAWRRSSADAPVSALSTTAGAVVAILKLEAAR
jgi:hypothetical protein